MGSLPQIGRRRAALAAGLGALALVVAVPVAGASSTDADGVPLPTAAGGPAPTAGDAACSTAKASGGEWPTYARDLSGNRHQTAENTIGPAEAATLKPAWTFKPDIAGLFNSTPVVADGCLYVGSSSGSLSGRFAGAPEDGPADYDIYALNADTGKPAWTLKVPTQAQGVLGTGVVGSLAVDQVGDRVYALVSSRDNPYAIALDQATGNVLWATRLDDECGAYTDASPILFRGMVVAGWNQNLEKDCAAGGYSILDMATGEVLVKNTPIPPEDYAQGHRGGSVWATIAVDEASGFGYVGTSNPNSLTKQHPNTNALIRIDLNRTLADGAPNPHFGRLQGTYEGTPDHLPDELLGLRVVTPICTAAEDGLFRDAFGDTAFTIEMAVCLNGDQDFGASPQLFPIDGRMAVGALQKSGVYHVAWADTMEPVWKVRLGTLCVICNAGTAANDGETIYLVASPPGQLIALDARTGGIKWVSPVLDVLHFQGVTVANGVVYTMDSAGAFRAWDARSGLPVLWRPVGMDNGGDFGASLGNLAGSMAVARNSVYVGSGAFVAAYRPQTSPLTPVVKTVTDTTAAVTAVTAPVTSSVTGTVNQQVNKTLGALRLGR